MFDIGFWELFLIATMALIVLGPEKLPKAAKTVGLWVGKAKRSFASIKDEIDRELELQELKQQLEKHKTQLQQDNPINSIQESLLDAENMIHDENHSTAKNIDSDDQVNKHD